MKKIIGLLKQRWLITLLGVIAIALFIWYLGPLLGLGQSRPFEAELHRLIAIGILFLIWALSRVVMFWRAKRRNSEMMAGISAQSEEIPASSPDEQASQEELDTLNEKMEQAIAALKKARLGGGGRQFLYQLPWYIIIGPPGCGKTTLLKNSNLKFALEEEFGKSAIKGVGGTRNCDWWFAEDAVLLDTAGRYAIQDSHQELDREGWLGFLSMLKKYRRRRPVNGAIVAISISDLMAQTSEERHAHTQAIQSRIQELYEQLGVQVPIYVLFTKFDLLHGFMEYFEELNQEDRAQVWGATFDLETSQSGATECLDDELSKLEQRLHSQLLEKLERQRNRQRREAIYPFPQQFSALKGTISNFVKQIFDPSRFQQPVKLRGLYFTSATQEGSPIDRIMGSLASNFGIDQQVVTPPAEHGKSFFINRLLSEVIFNESGLIGSDPKAEQRIKLIRYGAFGGIFILFLLISGQLINAYFNSSGHIVEVQQQTEELQLKLQAVPSGQWDPLTVLPILDKARSLTAVDDRDSRATGWNFNLSQHDKLDQAASSLYEKLLREILLPSVMTRMEQHISRSSQDSDALFAALKSYLMLSHEFMEHYNGNDLQSWVAKELFGKTANSITLAQRESLARHLASLFEARPAPLPRDLDGNLVKRARATLVLTPLDQRVYGELKKRLMQNNPSPFRISDAAGRSAPLVFSRKSGKPLNEGLNTLYTYYGYHELFLPKSEQLTQQLASTSWVLGEQYQFGTSDNELELLRHRVHRRYLDDFVQHWRQLLADLTIQPFTSLEHAVEVLGIISSDQSPLLQLLRAVEKETSLFPTSEQTAPVEQIGGTWDSVKKRWRDLTTSLENNSPEELSRFDTARVTTVFNELNRLVNQSGDAPPPIDGFIALLNQLYLELTALTQTSGEALVQVKRKQISQVLNKVQNAAKQYPYPLDSMLTAITGDSSSLIQGNVCQHIQNSWQSKILEFCNLAIANRYPIIQAQKQEITPEDFGQFFRQDGMVDQFFQQYLVANVDRSQQQWRWIQQDDAKACVSEKSLRQFKRAQNIKNGFFNLGSQTPSLGFSLKPIGMSPEITHLNLTIDGQQLSYAHGPIITTPMTWPGPANTGQVSLQLLPRLAGRTSSLTFESPWALFRLFDQATISRGARSEQFLLDFLIGKRNVRFDLRASSAINPFKLNDLNNFRCPRQL